MKIRIRLLIYPIEFIEDGEKLVVITRVRLENAQGFPYNNVYFFLFEVKEGKIHRVIEYFDPSYAWISGFNVHLEPA